MNTTLNCIRPRIIARREPVLSDEELLVRYRETGDRELFAQLVRRYESELYSYLRRYLGDAEMAEDAFQAAFLQVHLKCDQFQDGRRFRPWLYTIATNQAIDAQRRNRRHRSVSLDRSGDEDMDVGKLLDVLVADDRDPGEEASLEEASQWLRGALDELSESAQTLIQLVYYQGLKYREAAEILEIPVGTVKSRLHTAIYKLNESWNHSHLETETE